MNAMKTLVFSIFLLTVFSCRNSGTKPGKQSNSGADSMQGTNLTKTERKLNDTTVKFLWLERMYDDEYKDSIYKIVINEKFCGIITEAEKAAIGYIVTFVGNDCNWDGRPNSDQSNLKCKIMTALKLGYQCSDEHLGFLRKWFRYDSIALKKLENCPKMPVTAHRQNKFEDMYLIIKRDTIIVQDRGNGADLNTMDNWRWIEKTTFLLKQDHLKIIGYKSWL
jgi:hypothetical protein